MNVRERKEITVGRGRERDRDTTGSLRCTKARAALKEIGSNKRNGTTQSLLKIKMESNNNFLKSSSISPKISSKN